MVTLVAAGVGAVTGVIFLLLERRPGAMVPLSFFRVPAFAGANLATLFLYAALNCAMFLLVLQLQVGLGLSPLAAGAVLPATVLMAWLSPRRTLGTVAGSRWPMALGSVRSGVLRRLHLISGRVHDPCVAQGRPLRSGTRSPSRR